jgi:type II secretory pathway pseudopilin PulG
MELLTVLAIVAILLTIAMSALGGSKSRAATARARAELAVLAQALEEYRRIYGDYPQTGAFTHATPDVNPASLIAVNTAESKLFNALSGVYGPTAFVQARAINGRLLFDPDKLTLEVPPTSTTALPVVGNDPTQKREVGNCFLDPWGRRYLYYYKNANAPASWQAAGYVLFSVGADGDYTNLPATGIVDQTYLNTLKGSPSRPVNADNIYATSK